MVALTVFADRVAADALLADPAYQAAAADLDPFVSGRTRPLRLAPHHVPRCANDQKGPSA